MGITRIHSRLLLPAVLLASALAGAPAARADVGETIIQRCTHGQSLSGFGQSDYSRALKELSADAEEYTDCANLIRQAQLAAAGRGGAAAAPESLAPLATSPAEQRRIAAAAHAGAAPVRLQGSVVKPGVVHANIASAFSSLPSPLLAMLGFLVACLVLVAGGVARNRFRGRRLD